VICVRTPGADNDYALCGGRTAVPGTFLTVASGDDLLVEVAVHDVGLGRCDPPTPTSWPLGRTRT
jgi:hypothetical protein